MSKKTKKLNSGLHEALVSLLVPVATLMIKGGFGIGEFSRAVKESYVLAAVESIRADKERISASGLSVVTGMPRKEISALLGEFRGSARRGLTGPKEQRANRVMRGWTVDPRFGDNKGGPATLALHGDRKSFSHLVRLYGGDVTPNSVLKQLERIKAVGLTRSGNVRLLSPQRTGKKVRRLSELARLFTDFVNTVSQHDSTGRDPIFFGFRDALLSSPDQAARFQRTFSGRSSVLLQGVEQWLKSQAKSERKEPFNRNGRHRVGIGVYLVKGSIPAARNIIEGTASGG